MPYTTKLRFLQAFVLVLSVHFFLFRRKFVTHKRPQLAVSSASKILYWLFGHAADFRPWECTGLGKISLRLLNIRFNWYSSTKQKLSTIRVKIFGDELIFTKDLHLMRAISGKEDHMFRNSDTIRNSFGRLFPDNLTMLKGEQWKRIRQVYINALNYLDLESLPSNTFTCLNNNFFDMIPNDKQEINIWDTISCATFDSFMKFTYGIEFNSMKGDVELLEIAREISSKISDRMLINIPLLWYLPFGTTKRLFKLTKQLNKFIDQHLNKEKEEYENDSEKYKSIQNKNLIQSLIVSYKENSNIERQFTKSELHGMLSAALFGGFDTITSSIGLLFLALCNHPKCQQDLFDEIKFVNLSKATKYEFDSLPYMNSFIKETQRLYSVTPLLIRVPNRDILIDDVLYEKNKNILIDGQAMGSEVEYWHGMKDLEEFRPERFLELDHIPDAFIPFGFGGRKCPGFKLATVQIQSILCFLVQNFLISPGSKPIELQTSLGVSVSTDSTVTLTRRKNEV